MVTFHAAEHHRPLTSNKLYCFVTWVSACEQVAHGYYKEQRSNELNLQPGDREAGIITTR